MPNSITNRKNNKNPNWKGDSVGYGGLHWWVRRNLPKPERCVDCNADVPVDLANISQKYKRDINDFKWLCRYCHIQQDKRFKGERHYRAKLNEKQVRLIKHIKKCWPKPSARELGLLFKVSKSLIESIWYEYSWTHVEI